VTASLNDDLLRDMDRREKSRAKFVAEAVRRELDRHGHAELRRSLQISHPESADFAEQVLRNGFAACRKRTRNHSSTSPPAKRLGGFPVKAGLRTGLEAGEHLLLNSISYTLCGERMDRFHTWLDLADGKESRCPQKKTQCRDVRF